MEGDQCHLADITVLHRVRIGNELNLIEIGRQCFARCERVEIFEIIAEFQHVRPALHLFFAFMIERRLITGAIDDRVEKLGERQFMFEFTENKRAEAPTRGL